VAHHIKNYANNLSDRVDINNGITLCKKCHINYHSIYGYKNTKIEQLNEFKNK